MRAVQVELLEQLAALTIWPVQRRQPIPLEHVEDQVGDGDPRPAVQHPLTQTREARELVLSERDELNL